MRPPAGGEREGPLELSSVLRWSRALAFTVLVPGTVTVVLPYYLLDGGASLQQLQSGPPVMAGGLVLLAVRG